MTVVIFAILDESWFWLHAQGWKSKQHRTQNMIRNTGRTTTDMETCKAARISNEELVALNQFV